MAKFVPGKSERGGCVSLFDCADECAEDTLADFSERALSARRRYPSAVALTRSMHGRMQEVIRCKGGMTKY